MQMEGKPLGEVLDLETLTNKRVCIDEVLPQNVDFLVIDLSDALGLSIFTFSETAMHYRKIAESHSKKIVVRSFYDGGYALSDIVDDVWSAANIHGNNVSGKFLVYRSGTCKKSDWYGCDVVVRVQPLDSGVSADVDGRILVFSRSRRYPELRYKVLRNKTVYYTV
ncbi:hypothetical protein [Encephalitozoon cuniculi GB-M1]|uniref:Uncharacterized protein n=1 Tax=Encephalitozoon cuniculi (strain GB-M1) TaxID=284813 RepID=Q8SW11_ENCCU|nr:uncharacterized protein ECU03_1300 [Encephalitozoon cuniculi GB-M1]KMV66492.1 hypothetical protein M970_031230 [Encephalitozoon cuniculi EcunIII-L]CAD26273.1 hypothetical protein [Encephalitozoon cuniculi GB-M1]